MSESSVPETAQCFAEQHFINSTEMLCWGFGRGTVNVTLNHGAQFLESNGSYLSPSGRELAAAHMRKIDKEQLEAPFLEMH